MGRVRERDELRALIEAIPGRTLAAKLRRLLPDIERRIQEGVQHQEIVEALNRHGGFGTEVKLATLRSYLFRYRKAQREGGRRSTGRRLSSAEPDVPALPSPPVVERSGPQPPLAAQVRASAATPSALRQVRDEVVDLEALAELGKVTRTRKGS